MNRNEQSADRAKKAKTEEHQGEAAENCRCKETAEMSPRELLSRMISDLSFWKKAKKK